MSANGRIGPGARRARLVTALREAVFASAGSTDPQARRAAGAGESISPRMDRYLATVRDASYRVTDADIDDLRSAGHAEDEIFELTLAAALGHSLRSFDHAVEQLRAGA